MKLDKLASLLDDGPEEEGHGHEGNLLSRVHITEQAFKKAYTYARLVCGIVKQSVECYGYLITPKGKKGRIVTDIYFAPEQRVSHTDVAIDGQSVIKAGREIDNKGFRVMGWWHSHADFETFHSGTDDENQMRILNAIAPSNYLTIHKEIPLIKNMEIVKEGKRVELYDRKNPNKKFSFDVDKGGLEDLKALGMSNMRIRVPTRAGFAYSLVVNAVGGNPYMEVAKKEYCGLCMDGGEISLPSGLRLVKGGNAAINEEDIKKDIKSKLDRQSLRNIVSDVTEFTKGMFGGHQETEAASESPGEETSSEIPAEEFPQSTIAEEVDALGFTKTPNTKNLNSGKKKKK